MRHKLLQRLPILGCAGFIALLFLANLWNVAVERSFPKLRIRSAEPLAGMSAPTPALWTVAAFLAGETQTSVSINLGRASPLFPISVRAKNQWLYSLFGVSGAANILVGREDQLFETVYIDEFCRRGSAPALSRIDAWANRLRVIEDAVETRGMSFIYLITPSKAARYHRYLPASRACPSVSRGASDKLSPFGAALDARRVAHIDGASLMTAQMNNYPIDLFPRGGTHWNLLGAALALRELTHALEAAGKGSPIGRFEFDWREAPQALGTDRDLLDLLNLLAPDAHYPTAIVTGRGKAESCARAPRLLALGGSFLQEIIVVLAQAPCPPDIDYWFYARMESGDHKRIRYRHAPGDVTIGEPMPDDPAELRESLARADVVLLEENEQNISNMRQIGDLLDAARALR